MRGIDVIALGGNAILPAGRSGTITEQYRITRITVSQIVRLIEAGRTVVVTHGNGPIVGNIVLRNEAVSHIIPPMPLYICGADSQGGIGLMIQQTLGNALRESGIEKGVVSIVTQVLVDPTDPAFGNPTKPIGPFYSKREATRLSTEKGWSVVEDSNRGWRRVVPSPRPVRIVEAGVIEKLVEAGVIVVAVGGGGVPVVERNGELRGVEAVIDKDLAASVLARELAAERFIIVTDVEYVYKDFGEPTQEPIREMHAGEARRLLEAGQFPPGSMGSKIVAALEFLEAGGERVLIAKPGRLIEAVRGTSGTTILPDGGA